MQNIKIEEVFRQQKIFSQDDLVLAKCYYSPPWPATIRNFWGYDKNEIELYTVDFIGTNLQSILQSEQIVALSHRKIGILKRQNKKDKKLLSALTKATRALTIFKKKCKKDIQLFQRFSRMYEVDLHKDKEELRMLTQLPDQVNISKQCSMQQDHNFWSIDNHEKLNDKKREKRDHLRFNSLTSISIEVKLISRNLFETKTTIAGIVAVGYCKRQQSHKRKKISQNASNEKLQQSGKLDNSFQNQQIAQ